jgi:hypothetical protein
VPERDRGAVDVATWSSPPLGRVEPARMSNSSS